jgi:hypothetical protein
MEGALTLLLLCVDGVIKRGIDRKILVSSHNVHTGLTRGIASIALLIGNNHNTPKVGVSYREVSTRTGR